MKLDLDSIVFPAMTYREMLERVYEQDWNTRRKAKALAGDDTFTLHLTLRADCPIHLAKEVLEDVLKKEQTNER